MPELSRFFNIVIKMILVIQHNTINLIFTFILLNMRQQSELMANY